MKIWIDDVRQPPAIDWLWCKSVNEAKTAIYWYEHKLFDDNKIIIDLDHDAGDYANQGGDYIKFLDWLEEFDAVDDSYSFHLHTMNPVGCANMRAIIQRNNWHEISTIAN